MNTLPTFKFIAPPGKDSFISLSVTDALKLIEALARAVNYSTHLSSPGVEMIQVADENGKTEIVRLEVQ